MLEKGEKVIAFAPKSTNDIMSDPNLWGPAVKVGNIGNKKLILHYPLDSLKANDVSGNEKHGTLWGGKPISGVFGDAVYFDGLSYKHYPVPHLNVVVTFFSHRNWPNAPLASPDDKKYAGQTSNAL